MKTICIFSALYYPHVGGVERYTRGIAQALSKRGYKVIIVTCKVDDSSEYSCEKEVEIIRVPSLPLLNGRFPIVNINYWIRICKFLQEKNINYVIINTRFYLLSLLASRWCYKMNIKSNVIEHGTTYVTFNNKYLDKLVIIYEKLSAWYIKKHVTEFSGVSKAATEWLQNFGVSTENIIYNGIDEEYMEQLSSKVLKKKNKTLSITYIGRLVKEKGIINILCVAENLHRQGYSIRLNIAGNGVLQSMVQEYASKYEFIQYLGVLDTKEVVKILIQTDVFLLPSRSEGLPTTLLEAGYCGCALIASNRGGNLEVITDNENGFLIEYNNNQQMEEAIKRYLKNRDLIKQHGKRAKEKIKNNFTWKVGVESLESIINNDN